MIYEINVAKDGRHFFATHERSLTYYNVKKAYTVLKEKFPESEGYSVSVTEWTNTGKSLDMDKF